MGLFTKLENKVRTNIPRAALGQLRKILQDNQIILDASGRQAFETDALTAYKVVPMAVVLPHTTEQVAQIMELANQYDIPVVPRGAGTSLAGGAIPVENAIVVCLSRMNKILDINYTNRTATVQAGVTNLAISKAVDEQGFFYAPDPSSQLACTIAGNIAMNSGGAHCLKYGVTTHNLLGVKFVTTTGEVLEFGGNYMDPAGYDFFKPDNWLRRRLRDRH